MTTRAEQEHMDAVAALGCLACRQMGFEDSPAEIHYMRDGMGLKRASHYATLPLCYPHHRGGGKGVAFHAGKRTWQQKFGSEWDLLEQVYDELNKEMPLEIKALHDRNREGASFSKFPVGKSYCDSPTLIDEA